jgi:trehalose 6-phosphate synthase
MLAGEKTMESRQSYFDKKQERFQELCQRMLAERRLIVASNRGPVDYTVAPDGSLSAQRGAGGLVVALSPVSRFVPLTWVATAMSEGDRRLAEEAGGRVRVPLPEQEIYLRFVVVPRSVYQRFYSVFCNPLLWFIQHYMWNTPRTPSIARPVYEAWEQGYVRVNQAFAQAVVEEARGDKRTPFIFLHDYHLYLAPADIREALPDAPILHFTHIPWPGPRYWSILPEFMRREIHQKICAADIVSFQTMRDVRDFLVCCEEFLKGVTVDHRACTVAQDDWLTRVTYYPISIDAAGLCQFAVSPEVQHYEESLSQLRREITIVRVDRAEPSKNIIRGFRAYDSLLDRYPGLHRRIVFLAFLVPSRGEVSIYRAYARDLLELAETINGKYGDDEWRPIHVFYEENYAQAIAAMRFYDVLLVNPLIDGMNLVAKEGPLVNTRDGVLVLSEMAGAHEQLGEYALSVCPTDLEGTVRALASAITMPVEEKRRRAAALRRAVQEEDITFWMQRQFRDLMAVSRRRH